MRRLYQSQSSTLLVNLDILCRWGRIPGSSVNHSPNTKVKQILCPAATPEQDSRVFCPILEILETSVKWRILSDKDICALVYSAQIPLTTLSQERNAAWKLGKHAGNEICYRLSFGASLAYKFEKQNSVCSCVWFSVLFCLSVLALVFQPTSKRTNLAFCPSLFYDVNPLAHPCTCPL